MNPTGQQALEAYLADLGAAAPATWIRQVAWQAPLVEQDGSDAGASKEVTVCVALGPQGLEQHYLLGGAAGTRALADLRTALADDPDGGWTVLRVELDRDGARRVDFSHEPARPLEDSGDDPFWDDVHEYLDRHRTEVEALATRLGQSGDLPEADTAPTAVDPRTLPPSQRPTPGAADSPADSPAGANADSAASNGGRLGKLFGRR